MRAASIALMVLVAGGAQAQRPYAWTISGSDTDWFENAIAFVPGLQTHYLWFSLHRASQDGVAAAEFRLASSSAANVVVSFTPAPGFLNAGGTTDLLLAVAGCPSGPIVAGNILLLVNEPGSLCFAPSVNEIMGTVDCSVDPEL